MTRLPSVGGGSRKGTLGVPGSRTCGERWAGGGVRRTVISSWARGWENSPGVSPLEKERTVVTGGGTWE